MYLLGYDIGTSSVKASLVDVKTGECVASAQYPDAEAPIIAHRQGWAEQEPEMWWNELVEVTKRLGDKVKDTCAVGISYQMHGLVCVDKNGEPIRPSIIWCDGRAVPYGERAFTGIGEERCLSTLLNSPGNFTASKLAWVKDNEPDNYAKIDKIMLPGDYIAMRLSGGVVNTTISGLSEGMFWNFKDNKLSDDVMDYFGFNRDVIPEIVPTFAKQSVVCDAVSRLLGIPAGTPISYRGGDQPNNALSLNVMKPGEIAATGGTSGVVYGVLGDVNYDPKSRVNTFAHVNHNQPDVRLGVLLCINGTGILNAWMRRNVAPEGISYPEMNDLAETVPVGSGGLSVIPFGNGAERVLNNTDIGASVHGISFNIHKKAHLIRAAHEGIAFSFAYGIDVMKSMGMDIKTIKAGHANMFLNSTFRKTLAAVTGASIELYETDGAAGAARGAGIGAGIYKDSDEAFKTLRHISTERVNTDVTDYEKAYALWLERLKMVTGK